MGASRTLFRPEVIEHQRSSWLGPILLVRPPSFALLAGTAAVVAVAALTYLVFGEYTKKARVAGFLVPENGVVKVLAPQGGIVREQHVVEGQAVRQGEVLLALSTERATAALHETQAKVGRELEVRKSSLRNDLVQQRLQFRQQELALSVRAASVGAELVALARELDTQRARIQIAQAAVERYRQLQASHFVSDMQSQQKRDELLDQEGRLQSLQRSELALQRDLQAIEFEQRDLPLKARAAEAAVARSISELDAQWAENEARREMLLVAPGNGIVTSILAGAGQAVSAGAPVLSIVPEHARLEAQLYAPSRAIGFIEPGRQVLLRYQAYPYQKFGQYPGIVKAVSRAAMPAADVPLMLASAEPVYRITVTLAAQTATAYGHPQPLQAGMQLEADVLLDRRRLIEWVFEPLYSLTGRG